MPIHRRERGLGLAVLFRSMAAGALLPATVMAQQLPSPYDMAAPSLALGQPAPPPIGIHPRLNVQAMGTSNADLARGSAQSGKKEMILSVIPGVDFQVKGALSEIVGQFEVQGIRYVRGTQEDALLPSGDARMKLEAVKDAVGVEATLRSFQARATTTARRAEATSTDDAYTDTTFHFAPYFRGRIDNNTHAEIRLDRGWLESTQRGAVAATDRDARMTDDRIRLLRKPGPLGYEVQVWEKSERFQQDDTTALSQREASVSLLAMPDPEVSMGLKLARTDDQIRDESFQNTSVNLQGQWRPTARSLFQFETGQRSYGRTWLADAQHRWRRVSIGLRAERAITSYAREAGRQDRITPEPFDTGAQLRQLIHGRMVLMGRRNQVNITGGFIKAATLTGNGAGDLVVGARRTREHYLETELIHQLTPIYKLTGSVRWGRTWETQQGPSRDFVVRAAVDTRLSPDTTATVGLKRQITHLNETSYGNETAGYVNLGHRF